METDITIDNIGIDNKSIMLIEDDDFLSEMLVKKFKGSGFDISLFKTASKALGALKLGQKEIKRPAIILLDIILPGMDGFEFLEAIKADSSISDIPVIVLSNLGQDEEIEKAKKLGAKDYMVKAHFSLAEIVKKVDNILSNQSNSL